MTRDGTTLTIDVFVLVPILAILAGLALILWQSKRRKPPKDSTDDATAFSIRALLAPIPLPDAIKLAGFGLWATLFATLGFGVFFAVITALIALPGAGEDSGFNLLRGALITVAAITATLGAVVALPFTLIRVRATERQTRTQEEGYVTDQINSAVANLAAQKEINRLGRNVAYKLGARLEQAFEWEDESFELPEDALVLHDTPPGEWKNHALTKPNIEIRIGAILALERLARQRAEAAVAEKDTTVEANRTDDGILDHPAARDHVRIMEILCAYIRENSKAQDAKDIPFGGLPSVVNRLPKSYFDQLSEDDFGVSNLRKLYATHLHTRPTDIQTALRVMGRRTDLQRACEGSFVELEQRWHGYRLDLRISNLQRADLSQTGAESMNFANAKLQGARLDCAALIGTKLDGAILSDAKLEAAILRSAQFRNAILHRARFRMSDLRLADLRGAILDGSYLDEADLRDADLDQHTGLNLNTLSKTGVAKTTIWAERITPDLLLECYGDGSVVFEGSWPEGFAIADADGVQRADTNGRLSHWSSKVLDNEDFEKQWLAFRQKLVEQADQPDLQIKSRT